MEDALHIREQLFICPPFGTDRGIIEDLLAEDFIELGSSGKIYARADSIKTLLRRASVPVEEQWDIKDYAARKIAEDCYLATYILRQPARVSRRATLWRLEGDVLRAVFHQGTVLEDQDAY